MAEITWIKLKTDLFEHDKIKLIEALPDCDTILIIWVKLLTAAGKANSNGFILLSENIPMNVEEMATIFNRPLNTVRLALQTFMRYGMIEKEGESIRVKNWENHQNIDGMDKIKLQNRLRKQKQREKQKQMQLGHVMSQDSHATELDQEIEQKKEEKELPYKQIIEYLNAKAGTSFRSTTKSTQSLIKARLNESFTVEDFKLVIDQKVFSWLQDPHFSKYLRPSTLFGTKFESYLNERVRGFESNRASITKEYSDDINF